MCGRIRMCKFNFVTICGYANMCVRTRICMYVYPEDQQRRQRTKNPRGHNVWTMPARCRPWRLMHPEHTRAHSYHNLYIPMRAWTSDVRVCMLVHVCACTHRHVCVGVHLRAQKYRAQVNMTCAGRQAPPAYAGLRLKASELCGFLQMCPPPSRCAVDPVCNCERDKYAI